MIEPKRRPYKAFTLVELLVVIGVIGVLVAIGAYTYSRLDPGDKVTKTNLENLRAIFAELESVDGPAVLNYTDATLFAKFQGMPAYQAMISRIGSKSVKNGRVLDGWGNNIVYYPSSLASVKIGVTAAGAATSTVVSPKCEKSATLSFWSDAPTAKMLGLL